MPPTAKMSSENIVCPVCTLFLRPGMTLTAHLGSHPKQKVIEALVRLSLNQNTGSKELAVSHTNVNLPSTSIINSHESNGTQTFMDEPVQQKPDPTQNFGVISGNHSFIYQQFMSTSSQQSTQAVLNGNPMTPQYITIPTVFSPQIPQMAQMPQMVCSPYVYQQQQVIMSSGPSMPPLLPKPVPISQHMHVPTMHPPVPPPPIEAPAVNSYDERNGYILPDNDKQNCIETITRSCSRSSINSIVMSPVTSCHEDYRSQASMSPVFSPDSQIDTTKDENDVEDDCKKEDTVKDDEEPYLTNETLDNDNSDCSQKKLNRFEEEQKDEKDGEGNVPLEAVDFFGGEAMQPDATDPHKSNCSPSSNYYNGEGALNASNCVGINNSYNLEDPVFTISNAFGENETGNVNSLDNINLILPPDFTGGQFISRVEDFENIHQDDKRIIMNIGCMDNNSSGRIIEHLGEESMSQASENVSIRADEHMPARGELSGPESNGGASDTVWGRLNYEGNSRISASYDILQESWDASDGSFTDVPPLQSRNIASIDCRPDENDDSPTVISVIAAPKNFKCSICGDAFDCLKERRLHHKLKHKGVNEKNDDKSLKETAATTNTANVVGAKIGTKRVKKLVIKSKPTTENNFDNVFTNKIRSQQQQDSEDNKEETDVLQSIPIKVEDIKLIKTELVSCHLCDRTFPTIKLLKSHSSLEHNLNVNVESKRQCAVCDETFQTESDFNKHLMIHPLECRICGKCFYRKQNMQLHMKRHLGIRPYKCDLCGKSFLTKQKCNEHRNIHTGDTPIRCRLCNETFKRHSNLIQHRNKHHFNVPTRVKRDYICFCGEVVHSKKKLAWHKEIHEIKPKACLYCSEKFVHSASLTRHMRRAHNQHFVPEKDRSSENVECPICKKIYLRSSLDAHIRSHSGQKSFTCPVCNKDFTTKWNLKLHKWTHAARSSKPFKCDQCRGAFIRESEYVAHMNSHKSVRPYTCNHCGAQFIRKYNCQRHVKEHLSGKSFSCNICGKTFHRSYYLKDHMRVHNGTRPFACHVCGKTSTTKSNHNKHIRIHHAREPVSTEN